MLGLGFNDEQRELRNAVRTFLGRRSDEERVRAIMGSPSGLDDDTWRGLAELGCHGLTVSDERHGAGATLVEQGVVFEELGRSLACVPYFATIGLALDLLHACEREGLSPDVAALAGDAITRIADGDLMATVAVAEPDHGWDLNDLSTAATAGPDGWRLSGTKAYVPEGHLAGLLLVVARHRTEVVVLAVDPASDGVRVTQVPVMDQTRRQARIEFDEASATLLVRDGDELVRRSLQRASALLAVEQVGVAQRMLDGTLEYVKVREQFGRPVGSFQAVKHRLADVLMDVEGARSAAYYAVVAAHEDGEEMVEATSLAKAYCSDALVRTANATIQLHGGIGLTWEHWAHLCLKRARSSAVLLGTAQQHRERLAVAIGI